jgi:ethanolamine kinase
MMTINTPKLFQEYYVDLDNPTSVEPLLYEIFPEWSNNKSITLLSAQPSQKPAGKDQDHQPLQITQLTGGITNKLFQVHHFPTDTKLLVRAYGNGTSAIIDRDREIATHVHLYEKGLAPRLFARFGNGLVYQFLEGKASEYRWLSLDCVADAVARRLGQWHRVLDPNKVEELIIQQKKTVDSAINFSRNLWELLDNWIEVMPENVVKNYSKAELKQELSWIKANIGHKGGDLVVAHCDLLAGNVIVPNEFDPTQAPVDERDEGSEEPQMEVLFIDYEYAMLAPRAFDLANHFMEWQGFDCITELIPVPVKSNVVLRKWARSYLGFDRNAREDAVSSHERAAVDQLLDQVFVYWGMPGFYWGVWAAIQSSISDIDFDYASYANLRLEEYTKWKKSRDYSSSL